MKYKYVALFILACLLVVPALAYFPNGTADGYTKLLMHFDNVTSTAEGTFFKDEADHTVTRVGLPATNLSELKFGTSSVYFNGTSDYLTIADSVDWEIGNLTTSNGEFALDAWVYRKSVAKDDVIFSQRAGNYTWMLEAAGSIVKFTDLTSAGLIRAQVSSTTGIPANTWTHVEVDRSGATFKIFINGVDVTATSAGLDAGYYFHTEFDADESGRWTIVAGGSTITVGGAGGKLTLVGGTTPSLFQPNLLLSYGTYLYDVKCINTTAETKYHEFNFGNTGGYLYRLTLNWNSNTCVLRKYTPTGSDLFSSAFEGTDNKNYPVKIVWESSGLISVYIDSGAGYVLINSVTNTQISYGYVKLEFGQTTPANLNFEFDNYSFSGTRYFNHVPFTAGTALENIAAPLLIGNITSTTIPINYDDGQWRHDFLGHIDEARITQGTTRHLSGFTPENKPFSGPDSSFTSVTTTSQGQYVPFTGTNTTAVTSFTWLYGDGGSETLAYPTGNTPSHLYTVPGVYTVEVRNTNGYSTGMNVTRSVSYLTVNPMAITYYGSKLSGVIPLVVQFTLTNTTPVDSYLWTFGDGGTSTLKNPTYIYTAAGTYTVSVTGYTNHGPTSKTFSKVGYITAIAPYSTVSPAPTPTPTVTPGYVATPVDMTIHLDPKAGVYTHYWFNPDAPPNPYNLFYSLFLPLYTIFGPMIYFIIWGAIIMATWLFTQDITLPFVVGTLSGAIMATAMDLPEQQIMMILICVFAAAGVLTKVLVARQ